MYSTALDATPAFMHVSKIVYGSLNDTYIAHSTLALTLLTKDVRLVEHWPNQILYISVMAREARNILIAS